MNQKSTQFICLESHGPEACSRNITSVSCISYETPLLLSSPPPPACFWFPELASKVNNYFRYSPYNWHRHGNFLPTGCDVFTKMATNLHSSWGVIRTELNIKLATFVTMDTWSRKRAGVSRHSANSVFCTCTEISLFSKLRTRYIFMKC
jgi:hypothetical protein